VFFKWNTQSSSQKVLYATQTSSTWEFTYEEFFYFEKEMAGASAMHIKAKLCKAGYHSSTLAIIPSLNSGQFEKH